MTDRHEHWEQLEDYQSNIVSLNHRKAGEVIRSKLQTNNLKDKAVADIGCGPGFFLDALTDAKTIYAVDFSSKMLAEAKIRAPKHTSFIESNLLSLELNEPLDLILSLNAYMPENHTQALNMLEKLFSLMNKGGTLLMVVPSMECFLYRCNLEHFMVAKAGKEEESLVERMTDFVNYFNNPLGYVKDAKAGQVVKYWLADEMKNILNLFPEVQLVETFKAPVNWTDYSQEADWQNGFEPPWCWGFVVQRS
tara:strand:- start:2617 stop:3366 length:750 start_codon:yes stop_codon:yes gene_type:complete